MPAPLPTLEWVQTHFPNIPVTEERGSLYLEGPRQSVVILSPLNRWWAGKSNSDSGGLAGQNPDENTIAMLNRFLASGHLNVLRRWEERRRASYR